MVSWDQCLSINTSQLAVEGTGKVLPGAAEFQGWHLLERRALPGTQGETRGVEKGF